MTQTSSGIEPVFQPYYTRRRKVNTKEEATFIDEVGDYWEEYKVFHHKFKTWFEINKKGFVGIDKFELEDLSKKELDELVKQSPYYKATSADVDYIGKVKMQGRIQRWIDHSISVTVNMPEDVSEQTVSDVYMEAWKSGCKGITVYREGSRSGVLISDSKKETKESEGIIYNDAVKRPETLKCDIYNISRGKQPFTIVVGLLKEKPYEIFAFEKLSNCEFPDKIEKGELRKVKSKTYELKSELNGKQYVIPNIISLLSLDEQKNTRKFSSMLRHGIHPKFIIEQISEYAAITSFDKVISKTLSNYLGEEKIKGEEVCPECGGEIKNESGCVQCLNPECGWSRCS